VTDGPVASARLDALRVLVADDSFLVRDGVVRMLTAQPGLDVVGATADLPTTLAAVDEHRPDVVLTDIRMPPSRTDEGLRVADHCRRCHPRIGVVLLSQYIEVSYVRALLVRGTERRGYLLKERVADVDDLLAALRAVHTGGSAIDPKVVESLVTLRSRADDGGLARLSPRELQVLAEVAQGRTNAAVADHLVLTRHAVEKHINSIFAKLDLTGDLDVHPRVRATLLYLTQETT